MASALLAQWHFAANDASLLGWLVTVGYLLSAVFCFGAWRKAEPKSSLHVSWLGSTAFCAGLGLNKELDLQTLLIETARSLAESSGLYGHRRLIQGVFVIVLFGAVGCASVLWLRRGGATFLKLNGVFAAGLALVVGYCLLRAVSISHLDYLGASEAESTGAFGLVELIGVSLLLIGAARASAFGGQHPRRISP